MSEFRPQLDRYVIMLLKEHVEDAENQRIAGNDEQVKRHWLRWSKQDTLLIQAETAIEQKTITPNSLEELFAVGMLGLARIYLSSGIQSYKQDLPLVSKTHLIDRFSEYTQLFVQLQAEQRTSNTITGGAIFWLGEQAQDTAAYYSAIGDHILAETSLELGINQSNNALFELQHLPSEVLEKFFLSNYLGVLSALATLYARHGRLTGEVSQMAKALLAIKEVNRYQVNAHRTQTLAKWSLVESSKAVLKGEIKDGLETAWMATWLYIKSTLFLRQENQISKLR